MPNSPASAIGKRSSARHTGRANHRHMKTAPMTELPHAAEVQEVKLTDALPSSRCPPARNEEKASLYMTSLENVVEAVTGKVAPFGGALLCLARTHAH